MKRTSHTVYFCLGTNLGDKKKNLAKATELIGISCGVVEGRSKIYQSLSWGYQSDNDFYNQCLKIISGLTPEELLENMMVIEQEMGRERKDEGYADRIIDIDILFYDNIILETDRLVIPHPRIQDRMFVLKPMVELEPEFMHPSLQVTLKELSAKCKDKVEVKMLEVNRRLS